MEEVLDAEESELLAIEGFDEEIVKELVDRSNKYLAEKEEENQSKINNLNVSRDLVDFDLLSKSMLVKLAENNIKSLEDFAGLTTDDLIGYFEDKSDKSSKVEGLLEEFNLTKDEGDQLIMEARKIWLCLLYTSPSPRDLSTSRMPSSA